MGKIKLIFNMQRVFSLIAILFFLSHVSIQAGDKYSNLSKVTAIGIDNKLYSRNANFGRWEKIQAKYNYIGVCYNGKRMWTLEKGRNIYQTTDIKKKGKKYGRGGLKFITECGNGRWYGIRAGKGWYTNTFKGKQVRMSYPRYVKSITCNKRYVVVISRANNMYWKKNNGKDGKVKLIKGTKVRYVAINKNNNLWALKTNNGVMYKKHFLRKWKATTGRCKSITTGGDGYIWCVGMDSYPWIRTMKSSWRRVTGKKVKLVYSSQQTFSG